MLTQCVVFANFGFCGHALEIIALEDIFEECMW
jgi:hypothetical protein